MSKVIRQKTKTLVTKDNGRSSDAVSPNFVYGCLGGCMQSYCVLEGTLISTPNELIPVEKIQGGQSVFSYNSSSEQVEEDKVLNTSVREASSYFEIQVDGKSILVTGEHPFYTVDKGWVEAQHLTEDDVILCDVDYIMQ